MDTITLIKQAHLGDKKARDKLLIENTGLIWSVVRRFLNRGHEGEDLFQIGCIGMLKAIDRFDLDYKVAFSTYAVPLITGEIRRFLRDDGIIKISRTIKENQVKIIGETEKFKEKNKREPTIEEIAKGCNLSKEDVVTAIESLREVESIYRETDSSDGKTTNIIDKIEAENKSEDIVVDKMYVYGTPWSGKHDISKNIQVKLGGIVFLERSKENWINEISPKEAFALFFRQTVRKLKTEEKMDLALKNVENVLVSNPIYRMGCNISDEAVVTAYEKIRRI